MSNDFSQFQDAFFEEAAEHLAIVEEGLLQLEQIEIFRVLLKLQ